MGRGKSPYKGSKAGEAHGPLEEQADSGVRSRGGDMSLRARRWLCGAASIPGLKAVRAGLLQWIPDSAAGSLPFHTLCSIDLI